MASQSTSATNRLWIRGFVVSATSFIAALWIASAGCSSTSTDCPGPDIQDASGTADILHLRDVVTDVGTVRPDIEVKESGPDILGPDASCTEPRPFGCPCSDNAQCNSGWCIGWDEGYLCTRTCINGCPEGWECREVFATAPDSVFVCHPAQSHLCRPCASDMECGGGYCLEQDGGQRCSRICDDSKPCPEGYDCVSQESEENPGRVSQQCIPSSGSCDCGPVNVGARRTCSIANDIGECFGLQVCEAETGWSTCNVETPAPEICDGVDNDCDGVIDPIDMEPPTGVCEQRWSDPDGLADDIVCAGEWQCRRGVDGTAWHCTADDLPVPPGPELCDGYDNDCDGAVDEDFVDDGGLYVSDESCGRCGLNCADAIRNADDAVCAVLPNEELGRDEARCVVVACQAGFYTPEGFDNVCVPRPTGGPCSPCSADTDCAGLPGRCVDVEDFTYCLASCATAEDCADGYTCEEELCHPVTGSCSCLPENDGDTRTCYQQNESGVCFGGETCDGALGWSECTAETPAPETCDGFDNDCNGFADDGVQPPADPCQTTYADPESGETATCGGAWVCAVGEGGVTAWRCTAPQAGPERCDYVDNDCDGATDEPFPELYQSCSAGVGMCQRFGFFTCSMDGLSVECNATAAEPGEEICNNQDDDCDGATDEGEAWTELGQVCSVGDGVCRRSGVMLCDPVHPTGPPQCSATPGEGSAELCNDIDDDCDGDTDEDWPQKNEACTAGEGVCQQIGVLVCDEADPTGALVCNATPLSGSAERCNNQDDDCDGAVDEDFRDGDDGPYVAIAHCGGCGIDCQTYWPDAQNIVRVCVSGGGVPSCGFTCSPSFIDADSVPDNGCELFADPAAVFVSVPTGDNAADDVVGCGAWDAPCATIDYALGIAQLDSSKTRVLVSDGAYRESLTLVEGVDLLGGYNHANWQRDPELNVTSIFGDGAGEGHRSTVLAENIRGTRTVLQGFHIYGPIAEAPSANSYALRVVDCNENLVISDNHVFGGYGGRGADGAVGADGVSGRPGLPGLPPLDTGTLNCDAGTSNPGGTAGTGVCGGATVSGGEGATALCPILRNEQQPSGAAAASAGGEGGAGGFSSQIQYYACQTCFTPTEGRVRTGAKGGRGDDGTPGGGGNGCPESTGSVDAFGHWVGASGGDATDGGPGHGGGGGGSGGGVDVVPDPEHPEAPTCDSYGRGGDSVGASGGGGGAGGCGGLGGDGGTSGGGSFGIFVVFTFAPGSVPVIEGNVVRRGVGGPGGRGGSGGVGGVGGSGGFGGPEGDGISNDVWCAGSGGDGGRGGDGGYGGGGGGGCGGPSYGIFVEGQGALSPSWDLVNTYLDGGQAGAGGAGGSAFVPDHAGTSGADGILSDTNL